MNLLMVIEDYTEISTEVDSTEVVAEAEVKVIPKVKYQAIFH